MNIEYNEQTNLTHFTILCILGLIAEIIFEILIYTTMGVNMIFIILVCSNILIITVLILMITNSKNNNIDTIKSKGDKINAFITEAGSTIYKNKRGTFYYLCIRYNEKKMKITVKNNKTFKILNLLLNPYPITENIEIPVDMYIYKGNKYVDLENVELSKIKGYDEAKRIVENMNEFEE